MRNTLIVCSAVVALTVCVSALAQDDTGPLPPPPAGAAEYNSPAPAIPFERIGTQVGSMRTLFQGAGPGNSRVEIRELVVGPRAVVELQPPSGAALLDPRSGVGSVEAGGRTEQLSSGAVVVVPGVPLALHNSSDAALVVKLFIVEAR